jgi:hypothetical protein
MGLSKSTRWKFYFLALALTIGSAEAAEIKKCYLSPPQAEEQRSWRMIDGKKCWYIGPRKMDKSLLKWEPEQPVESEPMPLPVEAPPVRAEGPSEFEDRWQGLYDHRTARDPFPINRWRVWEAE